MAARQTERVVTVARGPAGRATEDQLILLLVTAPALARLAMAAWWHATEWAARTGTRAGTRVLRAAADGESPAELLEAATGELRGFLRELLDAAEPRTAPAAAAAREEPKKGRGEVLSLRARGADLLRRSADVKEDADAHPAYGHIIDDLAPDEARILRLLTGEGPRASVDVRTVGALGLGVGSELVAPGLNMIGAEAGCRHGERVPAYLNNLYRLGLIWFSREPLDDQGAYQVLEAQPEVTEALSSTRRGRTVRRSIQLTPFGQDFCDTCLPADGAELAGLDSDRMPDGDRVSGTVIAGDGTASVVE
jgi:hypothetical protein